MKDKLEELADLCKETDRSSFMFTFRKRDNMWVMRFTNSQNVPVIVDSNPETVLSEAIVAVRKNRKNSHPINFTL